MKLSQIPKGKQCKVKSLNLASETKKKLLELGLFPGRTVEVVQDAPFGGPVKIKIGDYCLALRKSEAEQIEVEGCDGT
ncbi:MAG: ferrous iron transport protein A [Aquificae bacterium]|nr:ferrous iron transport protein A [Aquificota bacterium]